MNADELDMAESTGRIFNDTAIKEQPEIPFCGCLSVRYYQPFFDVDTNDVFTRIASAVFYCNREQNFLGLVSEKPDAYGPFWVSLFEYFKFAFWNLKSLDCYYPRFYGCCFVAYKQLVQILDAWWYLVSPINTV